MREVFLKMTKSSVEKGVDDMNKVLIENAINLALGLLKFYR
jgi:hypothetical protein